MASIILSSASTHHVSDYLPASRGETNVPAGSDVGHEGTPSHGDIDVFVELLLLHTEALWVYSRDALLETAVRRHSHRRKMGK